MNKAKAAKEKVATIAWITAREIVKSEIRFSRIAARPQRRSADRVNSPQTLSLFPNMSKRDENPKTLKFV
jgi:hypothetical protein